MVSKDRCGTYAEAADLGAPHEFQVADRFHLMMNLSASVERALEERSADLQLPLRDGGRFGRNCASAGTPSHHGGTTKQQRRDRRMQRYQRVIERHQLGYTQRAISTELAFSVRP